MHNAVQYSAAVEAADVSGIAGLGIAGAAAGYLTGTAYPAWASLVAGLTLAPYLANSVCFVRAWALTSDNGWRN